MEGYVSVSEAARLKNVTRQAVYLAIRLKKLRAYKHNDKWRVFKLDLKEYDDQKYSRRYSMHNGELIFDEKKGYVSVERASKMINIRKQKLYYAMRSGKLKSVKRHGVYVICVEDLFDYHKNHETKNLSESVA